MAGFLDQQPKRLLRIEHVNRNKSEVGLFCPAGCEDVGFRGRLGQIAFDSGYMLEIVENDQAAGKVAQPVPRDFQLELVLRLRRELTQRALIARSTN